MSPDRVSLLATSMTAQSGRRAEESHLLAAVRVQQAERATTDEGAAQMASAPGRFKR